MPDNEFPRELTFAEAAALLRVSKVDIRLAVRKGQLQSRRRGSKTYIVTASLLASMRGER